MGARRSGRVGSGAHYEGDKKLIGHAEDRYGDAAELRRTIASSERARRARAKFLGKEYVPMFDPPPPPVPLLEENELAFELFEACQSQLITAGMAGIVVGVSHADLDSKMRRRGVVDPEEQFDLEQQFLIIQAIFVRACQRSAESSSK